MRHEKLPNYATYLVLNGSYSNVFWRSIGYVGIRNNSSKGYTFAAWPMYSVIPTGYNPTLYEIKPETECYFDFRGDWCLELVQGDASAIIVFDFQTYGGTGEHNYLKMC